VACDGGSGDDEPEPTDTPLVRPMTISSLAFADGDTIPARFTCDAENISPALQWSDAPIGRQSFALLADDPDAPGGVFSHWVVYNIPPTARSLPEGVEAAEELDDGTNQGTNDGGAIGYMGPCPPAGAPHHYGFTVYALDITLDVPAGAGREQVLDAIQGHILAEATLTGLYGH
jgi:hypothetical protein